MPLLPHTQHLTSPLSALARYEEHVIKEGCIEVLYRQLETDIDYRAVFEVSLTRTSLQIKVEGKYLMVEDVTLCCHSTRLHLPSRHSFSSYKCIPLILLLSATSLQRTSLRWQQSGGWIDIPTSLMQMRSLGWQPLYSRVVYGFIYPLL